jgi:hypothetical protein
LVTRDDVTEFRLDFVLVLAIFFLVWCFFFCTWDVLAVASCVAMVAADAPGTITTDNAAVNKPTPILFNICVI